jgi:hypothetical protein
MHPPAATIKAQAHSTRKVNFRGEIGDVDLAGATHSAPVGAEPFAEGRERPLEVDGIRSRPADGCPKVVFDGCCQAWVGRAGNN